MKVDFSDCGPYLIQRLSTKRVAIPTRSQKLVMSMLTDLSVRDIIVNTNNSLRVSCPITSEHLCITPKQWRIQDGAFGANAPPPFKKSYKIEIL